MHTCSEAVTLCVSFSIGFFFWCTTSVIRITDGACFVGDTYDILLQEGFI